MVLQLSVYVKMSFFDFMSQTEGEFLMSGTFLATCLIWARILLPICNLSVDNLINHVYDMVDHVYDVIVSLYIGCLYLFSYVLKGKINNYRLYVTNSIAAGWANTKIA